MKRLLFMLMALTTFMAMQAQDDEVPNSFSRKKFVNMNFVGRAGTSTYKQTVGGKGYKFKDVALTGGATELEFTLRGLRYQLEFDYQMGDMSDVTPNEEGKSPFVYDQSKFAENLKIMTGLFYVGSTMFPCKRFQIPIYAGFGCEYIQGYPMENFSFCFGFKGRAVFYLTKNVGLFAGYRYKLSANEKTKNDFEGLQEDDKMEFINNYHTAEVGLTIMLGRLGGNKQ